MTEVQHKALVYIVNFIKANGYSPSCREIAAHIGIESLNGVFRVLTALEQQGRVTRQKDRARSVMPTMADVDGFVATGIALFGRDAFCCALASSQNGGEA